MIGRQPEISVIIPTRDRAASLKRTLTALAEQNAREPSLEVIVVDDGSEDRSRAMLEELALPFPLRVVAGEGRGPGIARNAGAARARGRFVLFLDDDVEPTPGLVREHLRLLTRHPDAAIVGPYYPQLHGCRSYFHQALRAWWTDLFTEMAKPGHRYTYRDVLTGNLSLSRGIFEEVGGFDPAVSEVHEDWELGIRLLRADVRVRFAPAAVGLHHHAPDLVRFSTRIRKEGRADVRIGQLYPELRLHLDLSKVDEPASRMERVLWVMAFRRPELGDALMRQVRRLVLPFLERSRLRTQWHRAFHAMRRYWYWRGVVDVLGSQGALHSFLQRAPRGPQAPKTTELDLSMGLREAERALDVEQPDGVVLRYGSHWIGHIPAEPGAETLRPEHLRPWIRSRLAAPLLKALGFHETEVRARRKRRSASTHRPAAAATLPLPPERAEIRRSLRSGTDGA